MLARTVTFSDRRIVDHIEDKWVPVWEQAAPAKVAVYDLGDGKEVRGTLGGEIALYFCTPKGEVFDVLPALHSPHVTLKALERAYDSMRWKDASAESVALYHRLNSFSGFTGPELPHRATLEHRKQASDAATGALAEMANSKVATQGGLLTPILVTEPGGLELYKSEVHRHFAEQSELRTPDQWKTIVFEEILGQPLVGGVVEFDITSPQPFSVWQ